MEKVQWKSTNKKQNGLKESINEKSSTKTYENIICMNKFLVYELSTSISASNTIDTLNKQAQTPTSTQL